jgi:hypothetical protein
VDVPEKVLAAANDRRSGASEIAMVAAEGLLEVARYPRALTASVASLVKGQPAMAPIWHLVRAAQAPDPDTALRTLLGSLQHDTDAAVTAGRAWLDRQIGRSPAATVSHSSLVARVLAGREVDDRGSVGVIGADAIGPDELLNADGSAALARRLPTLVVATEVKLVPNDVFERLVAPGFERIPLEQVAAVVLGGEIVEPAEAGRRAAALAGRA